MLIASWHSFNNIFTMFSLHYDLAKLPSKRPQGVSGADLVAAAQEWATRIGHADVDVVSGLGGNERCKRWNGLTGYAEPVAEKMPEGCFQLPAGLHQAEHDVARDAAVSTDRAAGDLPFCDEGADVVLGGIGVERNVGPLEHLEQFVLAPVKADEQLVEIGIAGLKHEYLVEPSSDCGDSPRRGLELPRLEQFVEAPDEIADQGQ